MERDSRAGPPQKLPSYFNPRAPHGARPHPSGAGFPPRPISIHALRMERDLPPRGGLRCSSNFNPRAPHGARHQGIGQRLVGGKISIHALRMERDHHVFLLFSHKSVFQSTRSAWSATDRRRCGRTGRAISIHALRMERDVTPITREV